MKKLCVLVSLTFLLYFTSSVSAAIQVKVNDKALEFDSPAVIEKGRTLVPLRAIFESLGAQVDWDGTTNTVTAIKDTTIVKLTIGKSIAYKNRVAVTLDVPAKIINNRTMVPLRFVGEAMGAYVYWDGATQTVTVSAAKAAEDPYVASYYGRITRITNGIDNKVRPSVYGDYIVWQAVYKWDKNLPSTNDFMPGYYLYNTKTKEKRLLAITEQEYLNSTAIYGDYVAWVAPREKDRYQNNVKTGSDSRGEIYLYNIVDQSSRRITDGGHNYFPRIYNNLLVWQGSEPGEDCGYYSDIYIYNIETQNVTKITNGLPFDGVFNRHLHFGEPSISGDYIVYSCLTDDHKNLWEVYLYSISKNKAELIGKGARPKIKDDWVVFTSDPGRGKLELYLYNIRTGKTSKVNHGVSRPLNFVLLNGEKLVYSDDTWNNPKPVTMLDIKTGEKTQLFEGSIDDSDSWENTIVLSMPIFENDTNIDQQDIFTWTPGEPQAKP